MIAKKDFKYLAKRYLKTIENASCSLKKAGLFLCYIAIISVVVFLFAGILCLFHIIDGDILALMFFMLFAFMIVLGVIGTVGLFLDKFIRKKVIKTFQLMIYSKIFSLLSIQISSKTLDVPEELMNLSGIKKNFYESHISPEHSFISDKIQWMNFIIQSKEYMEKYTASFINLNVQLPIDGYIIAVPDLDDSDNEKINLPNYYAINYKGELFKDLKFYATSMKQSLDFLDSDFEKKLEAFLDAAFLEENGIGIGLIYLKLDSNGISLLIPDGPFVFDFFTETAGYKKQLFFDYGDLEALYKTAKNIDLLNQEIVKKLYD